MTSPWERLLGREPFSGNSDSFTSSLRISASSGLQNVAVALERLDTARNRTHQVKIIPFENSLSPDEEFEIIHIKLRCDSREVKEWDQPIVRSRGEGLITLECREVGGMLKFLFRPQVEGGLKNKVELGPSLLVRPGEIAIAVGTPTPGKLILECKQSEEGGRFFQDVNKYQIVVTEPVGEQAAAMTTDDYWLNLNEVQALLAMGGIFTNEARSVLSLLLKFL